MSRWAHQYVGLFLLVFIIWMSLSGILLNHPGWLRDTSVERWLVPPQYRVSNWNRGALRTAVFLDADPAQGYFAGSQGVWRTTDGGRTFSRLVDGFPTSAIDCQTSSLVLDEARGRLYAGTRGGVFSCDLVQHIWVSSEMPSDERRVYKLLRVRDELLVITPSHVLHQPLSRPDSGFSEIELVSAVDPHDSIPLVHAWFELHSGSMWGQAGRLIYDVVGLVMVFLSLSAAYLWYWPWKVQRAIRRKQSVKGRNPLYHWLLKYHLKLGIWLALIMFVIGATGFFMRPPLIALLAYGRLPSWLYPASLPDNPWHDRFRNAAYDPVQDRLLIEATDGFWETSGDCSRALRPIVPPGVIFVMGTTVFDFDPEGRLLLGSFSGLLGLAADGERVSNVLTGTEARDVSRVRPAETMVAGYFRLPDGDAFVVDHYRGLEPIGEAKLDGRFDMPNEMARSFRLPLWNFLFELHNGRIFRDLVGPGYALILPLGSLLFMVVTLSGVYDWFFHGVKKNINAARVTKAQLPSSCESSRTGPESAGRENP